MIQETIFSIFIDYYIISQLLYNLDGFAKNWIWCTWDGEHWAPTLYDVDSIFDTIEESIDGSYDSFVTEDLYVIINDAVNTTNA